MAFDQVNDSVPKEVIHTRKER
ncbi:protein of unknown function (plasmid) [Pseudorhizobium banfieldiae]|uniref:Uncharacterized protein n=1 Tax=Pseudorhizobium banfieldiae TaxID=1125847 RepID=L0NN88_9HYPH|nr:protein of unknown function [Pseudorhizobium banfieldiae]